MHTIYDECLDAMPFMPDAQGTTRESVMEGGFDGISLRVRMALCEGIVQITYMSGDVVCSEGNAPSVPPPLSARPPITDDAYQFLLLTDAFAGSSGFTSSRMYVVMRGRFTAIKGDFWNSVLIIPSVCMT